METAYAIFKTGGKQYRVAPGDQVHIEKLPDAVGGEVRFSDVLLVNKDGQVQAGAPRVTGAEVVGVVQRQFRDKKVLVFKKRSKKGYKKLQGHRQSLTEVLIKDIVMGSN